MPPPGALAAIALALLLVTGCGPRQPVLYPNAKLQSVGRGTAEEDIALCTRWAKEFIESGRVQEVAGRTATGAAVGGAVGGATGAVVGSAGRGAAAGAAGGAAGGFAREITRRGPDPVERRFVERCLRDRGYDVIGWK